jgi:hypothetical protein
MRTLTIIKLIRAFAILGLAPMPFADAAVVEVSNPPRPDVPGTVIFHGRYRHRNTEREIPRPSELWLKQTADGASTAIAEVPFMNSTEIAASDKAGHFKSHRLVSQPSGNRPGIEVSLEFEDGKARATRQGLRQDWHGRELVVPSGSLFDPNTRPDAYCAANILLRAFAVKPGDAKEFRVFDWDNTGDAFADYSIRIENLGKERVEVPAGAFEANHLVLTQKSSADTWFKKRAGHITDFWMLDNQLIVRIRRHREPYEVVLLDYAVPEKLPGQISGPAAPRRDSTEPPRAESSAACSATYVTDWTAFIREVDQAYPFFELKEIRRDWVQAKARLSERANTCASDGEFLNLVAEAIRTLRDAHMGLSQTKVPLPPWPKRYYPGVSFMPATENRVIVMSAEAHAEIMKPGTVVTKIDGRDARELLEENAKEAWSTDSPYFLSLSSPQRARLFAYRWPLIACSNQPHILHYLANGGERELRVRCEIEPRGWPHTYCMPTNLARVDRALTYAKLPSGAGYIYLRSVGTETAVGLRQALAAHADAKGWIIDLRGNGGGGYDTNLLAELKALPRPVVALIDAGCISAGETLARDLAQLAGAHLMGSRTAGASSSKRQWQFPSGIASVTFSTRSRWRSDGQPIEFNGIVPDEQIEAVPGEVAGGLNSEIRRAEEYLLRAARTGDPRSLMKRQEPKSRK